MLAENVAPMASHAVMIVILVMVVCRVLRAEGTGLLRLATEDHHLPMFVSLAAIALAVERGFYVAARMLEGHDIDLWKAYLAPELLALIVGAGLYAITLPIMRARIGSWGATLRRAAIDGSLLMFGWFVIVGTLL
ncbi:MAG: hypothetical protein AAFY65_10940 [Pseudomonadota bacterium]